MTKAGKIINVYKSWQIMQLIHIYMKFYIFFISFRLKKGI